VAVVNRGQKDIENAVSNRDGRKKEREFFATHPAYRSHSTKCGTQILSKSLNQMLIHHIRETLPDIKVCFLFFWDISFFFQNKYHILFSFV